MAERFTEAPRCPRCGYDLSGAREGRGGARPLEGVCGECGARFEWAWVLGPGLGVVRGFVEHERGGIGRVFVSAWRTGAWVLLPWVFWRRVGAARPAVPWRWLAWGVCVLGPLHIAAAVVSNARSWMMLPLLNARVEAQTPGRIALWMLSGWTYPLAQVDPWSGPVQVRWLVSTFPLAVWIVLGAHAVFWAAMLMLTGTRRTAGVTAAQVHRAGVFGLWWIAGLGAFRVLRNAWHLSEAATNAQPGLGGVLRLANVDLTLTALPLVVWTSVWWLCAVRDGWRIERWARVWVLVAFASVLCAAAVWQWLPDVQSGAWRYSWVWPTDP